MSWTDGWDWERRILVADAADWITVAAYLVVALLAWRAARAARGYQAPREQMFWVVCSVLMVALSINEILDLQTALTALGKSWAQAEGLYEQRRSLQLAFFVALATATVAVAVTTIALTRRTDRSIHLAFLGLLFIGVFILIRAASFHHLDALLQLKGNWFTLASLHEMAGIAIVGYAAAKYRRSEAAVSPR